MKTVVLGCAIALIAVSAFAAGPEREQGTSAKDRSAFANRDAQRGSGAREKSGFGNKQGPSNDDRLLAALVHNPRLAEQLELTDAQHSTLREAVATQRSRFESLKTEVQAVALKQARLISAEPLDEDALMAAVDEAFALRAEMAKLKIKQVLLMREVLTPEQMQRSRQMMQSRRSRMQDAGGERPQRPRKSDEGEQRTRPRRPVEQQ